MAQESFTSAESALTSHLLRGEHKDEVLAFLSARPVQTVFMSGFIRDNGLVSDLNRGRFYGLRDGQGRLEGAALIGRCTFIEARSKRALAAFARLVQGCSTARMILGEQEQIESFWSYFSRCGRTARRVCRQLLFERRLPIQPLERVPDLRLATPDDLPRLLPPFAEMALRERGVNPLEEDPIGFHERWLRRIRQGRVWHWTENGRLIFTSALTCETPEVIYLEAVYVSPDGRGKGYGSRCLSQLTRSLLQRAKSVCLLVNERDVRAQVFYQKIGYRLTGHYRTIFLNPEN